MSFVIYKCHSSFINVAYVLYFSTNRASQLASYSLALDTVSSYSELYNYVIQFILLSNFKLVDEESDQLVLWFTECTHCQTKTNSYRVYIELLTVNDPKDDAISGVEVNTMLGAVSQ